MTVFAIGKGAADITPGLSRTAYGTAMEDQAMAEIRPIPLGKQLHQILLDNPRIFMRRQTHPARQSAGMSVNNDAGNMENGAQNNIRRFAAYTCQSKQLRHAARYVPAMFAHQSDSAFLQIFRLVVIKSR